MRYDFEFTPGSTYDKVVGLLDRNVERGLVIDLGCGLAKIGEPLRSLGFDYLGCDVDAESLAEVERRGLAVATIDLASASERHRLPDRLRALAGDRRVAALTMLDVIEHLIDPDDLMTSVTAAMTRTGCRHLAISVPNVAHVDLAGQLVMGRWEVTDAGLLDRTHVTLFTHQRLGEVMSARSLFDVAGDDVVLPASDQAQPADAPPVARSTPLGSALLAWRRSVDEFAETNQFVRLYEHRPVSDVEGATSTVSAPIAIDRRPFATVVVRTRGRRPSIEDALTSLAAQTTEDFEVIVVVHSEDDADRKRVDALVDSFAAGFRSRMCVVTCSAPTRSGPLNLALDRARGRYLLFLDDDDVVLANWVEAFSIGDQFPGRIVRSRCYGQDHVDEPGISDRVWQPVAAPVPFGDGFDFIEHLVTSTTPFCSVALPVDALRSMGIRFDDGLDVSEDYDVLIRAAQVCGVIDTGVATSLYRRWIRSADTPVAITQQMWQESHDRVLDKLDAAPLLLPPGSARRVRSLEYDFHRLAGEVHALREYQVHLLAHRDELLHRVEALERSRFWRATGPLRRASVAIHRLARRRR